MLLFHKSLCILKSLASEEVGFYYVYKHRKLKGIVLLFSKIADWYFWGFDFVSHLKTPEHVSSAAL